MKSATKLPAVLAVIGFLCWALPAFGVPPPHPKLAEEIREGKKPEPAFLRRLREVGPPPQKRQRRVTPALKKKGIISLPQTQTFFAPGTEAVPAPAAAPALAPPAVGTPKVLVLLVDFTDEPGQVDPSFFDNLVFGATGPSLRDYFQEVSEGALDINGVSGDLPSDVGWVHLGLFSDYWNETFGYLISDPFGRPKLFVDAVQAAASSVDFSVYDNDSDGAVDYLILVHSGTGGELTGVVFDIWSQTVSVTPFDTGDGVSIDTFSTVPEYWYYPSLPEGPDMTIGVYAHEFGHLLGLVDLYDYGLDSDGIGDWGLMAHGMWNGGFSLAESPAWPCAWSRVGLEWVTPIAPAGNLTGVSLDPVESGGDVYYLWNDGTASTEFFLVENRQWSGYDYWLPYHGLMIWHIDESMTDNNSQITGHDDCAWPGHYMVALQQADGYLNLEKIDFPSNNTGDGGDPYPGVLANNDFSLETIPNSGSYADCASMVAVTGIAETGAGPYAITADIQVHANPDLWYVDYQPVGDVLPGRSLNLAVAVENVGYNTAGVTGTLSSVDPYLTVIDGSGTFGEILYGQTVANGDDPFAIAVDPAAPPGYIGTVSILLTDDQANSWSHDFPVVISPGILLVDDDQNNPDVQAYYTASLDATGRIYSVWDHVADGSPPVEFLKKFGLVIWYTGRTFSYTITAEEENVLTAYLDSGGNLLVSSQDYYYDREPTINFLKNKLHTSITAATADQAYTQIEGYSAGPAAGLGPYTFSPIFTNRADGVWIFGGTGPMFVHPTDASPTGNAAVYYDGPTYRSIFCGFPLEFLTDADRGEVMAVLVDWLYPAPAGGFDWTGGDTGCGVFQQRVDRYAVIEVGSIPSGLADVSIQLTCDTDVDIQLYDQDTGEKIIGWPDGIVSASTKTSIDYYGMTITYSGYNGDGTGWGHEYIQIEGATTRDLVMKAFGYAAGDAVVTYQWGGGYGSFSQPVVLDEIVVVGAILTGLSDVAIELTSDTDVDIQLYDALTGEKIVGWPDGMLNGPTEASVEYYGMIITYSGYNGDGTGWGHEFIRIEGVVSRGLVMKAYGYAAGEATVDYWWEIGGNSGSFQQEVGSGAEVDVGEIPAGVAAVRIDLVCETDVDIQLYDVTTETKIVGWPDGWYCEGYPFPPCSMGYEGMTIVYSGYNGDGTGAGHEYIRIEGVTTRPLKMKVYGYEAGYATVNYSWGCGP